jgi:hypothetical protein
LSFVLFDSDLAGATGAVASVTLAGGSVTGASADFAATGFAGAAGVAAGAS